MGSEFEELAGSPTEHYGPDGVTAKREIICDWSIRGAILRELLGDGYAFGGTGPAQYPNNEYVVVATVDVKPFPNTPDEQLNFDDITADINTYTSRFAKLSVQYKLQPRVGGGSEPEEGPEPGTFLTYNMNLGGEYVKVYDSIGLHWESNAVIPVPEDALPTILVPSSVHVLSWSLVKSPPWSAISFLRGKVNATVFCGYAAQTVLFEGCQASKEFVYWDELDEPQFSWKLTYTFREKTISSTAGPPIAYYGWCHTFRTQGAAPGWDRLLDIGNNYIYEEGTAANFNALFKYPTA